MVWKSKVQKCTFDFYLFKGEQMGEVLVAEKKKSDWQHVNVQ